MFEYLLTALIGLGHYFSSKLFHCFALLFCIWITSQILSKLLLEIPITLTLNYFLFCSNNRINLNKKLFGVAPIFFSLFQVKCVQACDGHSLTRSRIRDETSTDSKNSTVKVCSQLLLFNKHPSFVIYIVLLLDRLIHTVSMQLTVWYAFKLSEQF